MSDERAVRYPDRADSLEQLEQIVNDCPPWAVRKFAVFYKGQQLDYGAAATLVQQSAERSEVGR